jgi:MoxR-like ATPase
LGPLGTALLPYERPRALLIDEFDKSDFDLPGDLLEVLERGEFEIQELARHKESVVEVREWSGLQRHRIERGRVQCTNFPIIVITSNGEREFPAPFLRRCVRFAMPRPQADFLRRVVTAHLGVQIAGRETTGSTIREFVDRLERGNRLALDQLLSAIYLLTGEHAPEGAQRARLQELVLRDLAGGESPSAAYGKDEGS